MKLDDEVIAHIAKILQIAILSGTDVTDGLRMMRLTEEDGILFLNEEYDANFDENVDRMLSHASEYTQDQ
jgi:hypothetical protein